MRTASASGSGTIDPQSESRSVTAAWNFLVAKRRGQKQERVQRAVRVARAQVVVVGGVAVDRGDDQRLGGAHELTPVAKELCDSGDRVGRVGGGPQRRVGDHQRSG